MVGKIFFVLDCGNVFYFHSYQSVDETMSDERGAEQICKGHSISFDPDIKLMQKVIDELKTELAAARNMVTLHEIYVDKETGEKLALKRIFELEASLTQEREDNAELVKDVEKAMNDLAAEQERVTIYQEVLKLISFRCDCTAIPQITNLHKGVHRIGCVQSISKDALSKGGGV